MKRKTIVLLSSVMASALLVGGAFAAYAVIDHAEEKGIYTTPGTITPEQQVTLEWGAATGLSDVGDLVPATPKKAGEVVLVATPNDANIYTGNLLVHYEDRTTVAEALREAKFIDYLNVYVYEGSLEEPDETKLVGDLIAQETNTVYSKNIVATGNAAGKVYSIFIELDEAAESVVEKIQNDRVYVGFDWNKADGDYYPVTPVVEDGYYLVGTMNEWTENNNYKFTLNTESEHENEYYLKNVVLGATDEFKAKYHADEEAWFPDGEDNNIKVPTGTYDVYFSSVLRDDWATGETWGDAFGREGYFWFDPSSVTPEPEPGTSIVPSVDPASEDPTSETPVTEPGYYLVGNMNGWAPNASAKFTATAVEGEYLLSDVVLAAGNEFKGYQIVNQGDPVWIPGGDAANASAEAGTYDILFSPTDRGDWATGEEHEGQFGLIGHFWMMPKSVTPEPGTSEVPTSETPTSEEPTSEQPVIATKYGLYDVTNSVLLANLVDMEEKDYQGRDQASALAVHFTEGQKFQLYDNENEAGWIPAIESGSFGGATASYLSINTTGGYWEVLHDFTADIYAKFAYNNDAIYFAIAA